MTTTHFVQVATLWRWLWMLVVSLFLARDVHALAIINDCAGLQAIQNNLAGNYQLGGNIDCSATAGWNSGAGFQPLGVSNTYPFLGTFDGQGFTISGLIINRPATDDIGLFGYTGSASQIHSVGLVGCSIIGSSNVGGLVGFNSGTVSNVYATCQVTGTNPNLSLVISAGGLVGSNGGNIINAYATGHVLGPGSGRYIGGFVGYNSGTISNSYSLGSISGFSTPYGGGGLIAYNSGTVINAYWDTQASQQTFSDSGLGLSTALMQQESSFVGWDFVYTWSINPARLYPFLQVFMSLPVLSIPLPNITVHINELLESRIPSNCFTDPDGLQLEYTAALFNKYPFPVWLQFDATTQTFLGTPLSGAQGALAIKVTAHATASLLVSGVFQLIIPDRAPLVQTTIPTQFANNGVFFQLIIPDAVFLDEDGDRLQFTASAANNQTWPTWLSFNAVLGIFSGISTKRGMYAINVTAKDNFGGQVSTQFDIVTPNSSPQVAISFPNQVLMVGVPFSFTLPANSFVDIDGDPMRYSATLFGGANLLLWLSFDTNSLRFTGTPSVVGFLMVTVTAMDLYNATASLYFGLSVSDISGNSPPLLAIQILDQTAIADLYFEIILQNNMFSDPDGDPLTYSAFLEGGAALPSWLNFTADALVLAGTPSAPGMMRITIRADDGRGGFALDTFSLTIKDNTNYPPYVLNPIPQQAADVGQPFKLIIPPATFADPNHDVLTLKVSQAGGPLPHWLQYDTATQTLSGNPGRSDTDAFTDRRYPIAVTASDGQGSAIASFDLLVRGESTVELAIKVLSILGTIGGFLFGIYRHRVWIWNHTAKRWYQLPPQYAIINQDYLWIATLPKITQGKSISWVQAYQGQHSLLGKKYLPDWLNYNTKTHQITGKPQVGDIDELDVCVFSEEGEILASFPLAIVNNEEEGQSFVRRISHVTIFSGYSEKCIGLLPGFITRRIFGGSTRFDIQLSLLGNQGTDNS